MSDSTLIYLIRHGETASNVEGRFRGRADIPLSENGVRQSIALGESMRNIALTAIYSSPLARSIQTAEKLAFGRNIDVMPHPKFQNIDLGEWTDRPRSEIMGKYPAMWKRWITEPEDMALPGGESVMDVQHRCGEGIRNLVQVHQGESIAVVSHRAVLKPLLADIIGIVKPFFWKLHLDTAGWTLVEYNPEIGFKLIHFNIVDHINELTVEAV
ncbi:MAG: histidine phosphatase family protein [bacterium]